MFRVPEKNRIIKGQMASDHSFGNNGAFAIQKSIRTCLWIIASDGDGWEHVSIHAVSENKQRTPSWDEMCFVKSIFWDEEDCVIQFHPPKHDYVNNHKYCLHLWRPVNEKIPMPNPILVGINI